MADPPVPDDRCARLLFRETDIRKRLSVSGSARCIVAPRHHSKSPPKEVRPEMSPDNHAFAASGVGQAPNKRGAAVHESARKRIHQA